MRRSLLLLVTLVVVVTACGGDGSSTSTTTTLPPAGATTTTAAGATTTTDAPTTTTTAAPSGAACDHTYFPVREGASWTFETLDGESSTWSIVSVSEDGASAVMEADLVSPETEELVQATVNLICDETGISAPELAFTGLPFGAQVASIEEDGFFLLSDDALVEGTTWESTVRVEAVLEGGMSFEVVRHATYVVETVEEVTVPAGTFTAVRVRSDFTIDIVAGGAPIQSSGAQYLWFAEGVGLVKEAEVTQGDTPPGFGTELAEYTVP